MASDSGISLNPTCSGNDIGDFECNICFEVAQDPIVTLCGHLYCWPCLYTWLHNHSHCQECPVCKALVQVEKLVPIYGRGKTSLDPRSRSMSGADIPSRPVGQRPETAPSPSPDANYFRQDVSARNENSTFSAAFGGLIQSLNFHAHGFHDGTVYGATTGFPYWFSSPSNRVHVHGGHAHGFHHPLNREQRRDTLLKMWFLVVGFAVLVALISL